MDHRLRTSVTADVASFMSFLETRPDHERWELLDGSRSMMTPPKVGHQRIASNIERAINDALTAAGLARRADREIGIVLDDVTRFEPEVTVVDEDIDVELHHLARFYGVVEVLSPSDFRIVPGTDRSFIAEKLEKYRRHLSLEFIILARQDAVDVEVHSRDRQGWVLTRHVSLTDELRLPILGPICTLDRVYKGLPLSRNPGFEP